MDAMHARMLLKLKRARMSLGTLPYRVLNSSFSEDEKLLHFLLLHYKYVCKAYNLVSTIIAINRSLKNMCPKDDVIRYDS